PDAAMRVRDAVIAGYGKLDILINNAGGSRALPVDAPEEEWHRSMELNFNAARRLGHAFLASMQEQHWGRIVNITGTSEPKSLNAANSAKAALHAWSKGLSLE